MFYCEPLKLHCSTWIWEITVLLNATELSVAPNVPPRHHYMAAGAVCCPLHLVNLNINSRPAGTQHGAIVPAVGRACHNSRPDVLMASLHEETWPHPRRVLRRQMERCPGRLFRDCPGGHSSLWPPSHRKQNDPDSQEVQTLELSHLSRNPRAARFVQPFGAEHAG